MTTKEYRAALNKLGLSIVGSAEHLGLSSRQSQRYANGTSPVADPVAKLLRLAIRIGLSANDLKATDLTRDITPGSASLPGLRCQQTNTTQWSKQMRIGNKVIKGKLGNWLVEVTWDDGRKAMLPCVHHRFFNDATKRYAYDAIDMLKYPGKLKAWEAAIVKHKQWS